MQLIERVTAALGVPVMRVLPLHGGMIGEVYRVELQGGDQVVVKVSQDATMEIEGYMLRYFADNSAFPVPDVLYSEPNLLIMSFIDGQSNLTASVQRHAAELVADLHNHTADRFGLERDTLIGPLHQPNPWMDKWIPFFREHRLLQMAQATLQEGGISRQMMARIERLADKLDDLLLEPDKPALIHGDLWTTNVLAKDGQVMGFIDPAVYYAHPEIELAYTTLFGTFGQPFFERYQQLRPITPGFFELRRHIYNLYPLLIHVRIFGGGYVGSVNSTLQQLNV